MEDNAPNQVIGTGSLVIRPEMQAVLDSLDRIDKRLDDVREKASKMFEGIPAQLSKANDELDRLRDRFKEINFDEAVARLVAGAEKASEHLKSPDRPEPRKAPQDYGRDDFQNMARDSQAEQTVAQIGSDVSSILAVLQMEQVRDT